MEGTPVLISDSDIDGATARIAPHVLRTPLVRSHGLSEAVGRDTYLKCELFQPTGSFKVRGVFNKAQDLPRDTRERGIIAFSAGNHAMAAAHVGVGLGLPVTVCMPAGAVQFKVDAVRSMGADLELVDGDLVAHVMARRDELGAELVHPFDDPAVVAGTATIGREIVADLPDVDVVLVPVGGGGLISGVATAIKRHNPNIRVIGIEPDSADVIRQSRKAGHPVTLDHPKTLADGLGAPITGEINLAHIDAYVDEMVTVPEAAIRPAWQRFLQTTKLAAEPSPAVCLAALELGVVPIPEGKKLAIVVSGGNADLSV